MRSAVPPTSWRATNTRHASVSPCRADPPRAHTRRPAVEASAGEFGGDPEKEAPRRTQRARSSHPGMQRAYPVAMAADSRLLRQATRLRDSAPQASRHGRTRSDRHFRPAGSAACGGHDSWRSGSVDGHPLSSSTSLRCVAAAFTDHMAARPALPATPSAPRTAVDAMPTAQPGNAPNAASETCAAKAPRSTMRCRTACSHPRSASGAPEPQICCCGDPKTTGGRQPPGGTPAR